MKSVALALALLLVFGAARLPYEIHLAKIQQAAGFRSANLSLPLREQVGQMGFVAALSGFRSLVAAYLWIEASTAWMKVEWGRMAGLLDTVTTLQPKSTLYWDMSAWHMAWNAAIAAYQDPTEPSEVLRRRAQRRYWELGRKFYEDGLKANPDNASLWERLAILERDKFEDHAAAAKAFLTSATKPDAHAYVTRMAAYELAKIPGREQEAYDLMKRLYDKGPAERKPALVAELKRLEEKLGAPADPRIKDSR